MTQVIFLPQQMIWSQSSRPSFPRKIKNPCRELNMAKRNWKAVEASRTVRAPNTHVNPKRVINPIIQIMSLMIVFQFGWSLPANSLWICLVSTLVTMTNMVALKRRMGPRKVPKKTLDAPIKQLKETNRNMIRFLTT